MTTIESKAITTSRSAEEVYNFLSDLNNHQSIMPEQVSNWSSDTDTCTYTIRGTGTVHLRVEDRIEHSHIKLVPNGKIPFPFSMNWMISNGEGRVKVHAVMEADLNPILRMMAVNPLTNFINLQVQELDKVLNAGK